jgi:hypothetical protein
MTGEKENEDEDLVGAAAQAGTSFKIFAIVFI